MLEQIQEVVRKNLPAELGDQLKKHLSDAEGWKRERDSARADLDARIKQVTELAREVESLKERLKLAGNLADREKIVAAQENKLEVTLAQMQARAAEASLDQIHRLDPKNK